MNQMQIILLDTLTNNDNEYHKEIDFFNESQNSLNKFELRSLLHLISNISDNHHRTNTFFTKIENILTIFNPKIKKQLSNFAIFNIFKNSKRILLFLFKEKIIIPDNHILRILLTEKYKNRNYIEYFLPEIKQFLDDKNIQAISQFSDDEMFDQKRQIGENDNYICQLIRNDSIDEFITYINRNNYSLSSKIKPSIYETNLFLLKNQPNLIEYATFCGAIQIFQFLRLNEVEMKPSLWLYAIHGNNPEIIHLLENDKINPENNSFENCFKEAVKCHHIDLLNYINDNIFLNRCDKNTSLKLGLHYYNFKFCCSINYITNDFIDPFVFADLCKYDYSLIVDFLLKKIVFDIEPITI